MQILINLCPKDILEKEKSKRTNLLILIVVFSIVLILIGLYLRRYTQLQRLKSELVQVEEELNKLSAIVAQVETLEAQKQQLDSKLKIIINLLKETLIYPKFIEDFSSRVPANIWLDNFLPTYSNDYFTLSINATSLDVFSIAEFMTILEKSGIYENVEFQGFRVEQGTESKNKTYKFNMICNYKIQK